jgi:subtilisin
MRFNNLKAKIICGIFITFIINFASITSILANDDDFYIEVIVFFEPNESVEVSGVEYIYQWDIFNAFFGRVPYSIYEMLKKSPSVKFITNELILEGFRKLNEICPTGVWQIEADRVWGGERSNPNVGNTDVIPGSVSGQGIKVAIVDSGIDNNHDDLAGNNGGGINYIDLGYPQVDYDGHGTACAGIVAAIDNEIDVIGVAPSVTIYSVKGITSNPGFYYPALLNCIYWCIDNDMDVISMSWGGVPIWPLYCGLEFALNAAYGQGIVLVAGTGNYPDYPEDEVLFPACLASVIAVGAVDDNGERVDIPGWWSSCYGPESELMAPGLYIHTTKLGGGMTIYPHFYGTSAACPHVAGICALLLSQDPTLTIPEIRTILWNTAQDVGEPGWDEETGFGLVNAYGALDAENPAVSITNPYSFDVSGIVSIIASATDNYRVDKVQFKIDSESWHIDNDGEDGWSWFWDTTNYNNGLHTIKCRAYDARGNWAQIQKTVNVDNSGGGGGGCPILSVYNGTEFIEEGLLNIHNPDDNDVVAIHELVTEPYFANKQCFLRLTEHFLTISHIDKVELYDQNSEGLLEPIVLKSALHSSLGNVLNKLKFSDDNRVEILGAIHNNGTSEYIDLKFKLTSEELFSGFIFIIEGYNILEK